MVELNSNQFPEVYNALGVKISDLGFVGLELEPLDIVKHVEGGEDDLYYSTHPDRFWIKGPVGEVSAHMTVMFGLMEKAYDWAPFVDQVLDGWKPESIEIDHVGYFPSNIEGEDYSCIVGHVKVTPEILEGHQRLQLLPHIETFPLAYRPHVTLAYVKNGPSNVDWAITTREKWVRSLQGHFSGVALPVQGLTYGSHH
jgi:2'-5' RNA ligase